MTQTKALKRSAATTGKWAIIQKRVRLLFVLVIWTLVLGADLELGAWNLVLQSYPLLKVI